MNQEFELIAKTFQGLEEILAQELTELGASNIEIGRRMVSFTGDKAMMYKANFCLRTAIRILKPIKHFTANNADEVYEAVKSIAWEEYLDNMGSFAVDAVVFSNEFRHSKFVAYKVKDAIVDYFREKTGNRPSVRINKPDLAINIHIAENQCTLSLDSSGESLHRRGYRQEQVEAPLNEVLAAGMILMTGWRGECDFIDPMCGSGTLPIEAALIARNIAPGVFRKEFGFEKWKNFDQELFDSIYNDDSKEREFTHKIYGFDNNPKANEIATHNVKAAGVSKDVVLRIQPFQQFEQPKEKSIIVTNPPYGERISSEDLLGLYKMIGERLKHAFTGNDAWILSYREECFDEIGLKPSIKVPLFNGSLECQFRKYQLFDGRYKAFRSENSDKEFKPKQEDKPFRSRRQGEKVEYGRGSRKEGGRKDGRYKAFRSENSDKEFKPKQEDKPFRSRRQGEKVEYGRGSRKEGGRKEGGRKEGPWRENSRKEGDRKDAPRRRRTDDGKEFTRERRREFGYSREEKPRTPRPWRENSRKEGDRKDAPRRRRTDDGKEFTRERRREFGYSREEKPRTPRPSTDDGRPKQPAPLRYMHRRREDNED